jgi:RimJ/RimL family protein N-acetyltransferase
MANPAATEPSKLEKPAPWSAPRPLPSPLRTDRLLMRFFEPGDAASMFAAINADRASLLPWLPWAAVDNRSEAECTYHIERFRREREDPLADDFSIGIFDPETGEVCGGTGFHRINVEVGQAEIGYWIRGDRARRGLCSEVVAALISSGFTPQDQGGWGFRRIIIMCAEPNVASRRVPEKLGLRLETRSVADRWVDGLGFVSTLVWGVLADAWDIEGRRLRSGPT